MKKNYIKILSNCLKIIALLTINYSVFAQIPLNAITADPSTLSVTQIPVQSTINGTGVIQFKFRNDAAFLNLTGQIPAGSVRVTITFPATFAFTSSNYLSKFVVEASNNEPNGVVTLVNNLVIFEQEELDMILNVKGTAMGLGSVTFNVSRTTPNTTANLETDNDNLSATFNTLTVLPVHLNLFVATLNNNCVSKINWQSTSEINLKSYWLEYSNDGNKYIGLNEVLAKGNNSNYSIDHNATAGKSYYRLKMMDFDGSYEYSEIVSLNNNCNTNRASVYPNPASELLNINITNNNSQITKATLYDAGGKAMLHQNFKAGLNSMKVNGLAKGSYTLHLNDGGVVETIQVLIK